MWAIVLPVAMFAATTVTLWSLWIGVVCNLAVLAVTATLIGYKWGRAGAATLAAVLIGALMLFAGPAVYDLYLKSVGKPVAVEVTKVVDEDNRRGNDLVCTVKELGGQQREHVLTQRENCWEQFRAGDRTEILVDPLGILKPRLADAPGKDPDPTLAITAGLTGLTALTIFYGSRRRRTRPAH